MSGRDISAADYAVAITPSDSAAIPYPRGIYVGVLLIRPVQVLATGTTATDILALY